MRRIWFAIVVMVGLMSSVAWADDGFSSGPFGAAAPEAGEEDAFIPQAPWSPGNSPWEEYYVQHIDLGGFMDRLKVVLTDEQYLGWNQEIAGVAHMFDKIGYFDIDTTFTEYQISGDYIKFRTMTEVDHSGDTFYSNYMGVEDQPLRSAKYVDSDDFLMYLGITGMVDKAMAYIGMLQDLGESDPDIGMAMEMGEVQQALAMVEALKIDQLVSDTLSGEIALVLYQSPDLERVFMGDIQPEDVHAAIMLGIEDPEYVLNMANQFGPDIGLVPVEDTPEGWHAFTMMGQESVGVAFNDEILIATPNAPSTSARVMAAIDSGGMDVAPCQLHFDLNVQALHQQVIHPLAIYGAAEFENQGIELPSDGLAYLFNLPEPSALGHITATGFHPDGNVYSEFEMKKSVLQYLVYYVGLGLCGAGQDGMLN